LQFRENKRDFHIKIYLSCAGVGWIFKILCLIIYDGFFIFLKNPAFWRVGLWIFFFEITKLWGDHSE
jgi:hypothetical protein